MNIESKWLRFAKTFVLISLVFSFGAAAQTSSDKPLEVIQLFNLVEELKEVLTKVSPDKNEAKTVIEKWENRTDLGNKTKSQVIDLLFEDVKSVIKDSETQYQIYSIFSFQKQIPNENQVKEELVNELIDLTISSHPAVTQSGKSDFLSKEPVKDVEVEKVSKTTREAFDKALGINKELTPGQRSFVRANYQELNEIAEKAYAEKVKRLMPVEEWVRESLKKSFPSRLSVKEISQLIAYFQSPEGQKAVKLYDFFADLDVEPNNKNNPLKSEENRAEFRRFSQSPLGQKFEKSYLEDTSEFIGAKMDKLVKNNIGKNSLNFLDSAEVNEILNNYVAEFYAAESENHGVTKRIKFAKGKYTATVSESVIRGDRDTYIVGANKGQTMTVKITALENNAAFTILSPDENYLENAGELDDQTTWTGTLPANGDYKIEVGGTRGNATYKLTVTIK